jgi:hypothetical protein
MRELWLDAVGRWEATRRLIRAAADHFRQPVPRTRAARVAMVLGVGINPRWGITVRLRRSPGPPDGGLRLVA